MNLKWSASSLFAGAPFYRAFSNGRSSSFFNWDVGGADTVGVLIKQEMN
jgi:hypothetical protein